MFWVVLLSTLLKNNLAYNTQRTENISAMTLKSTPNPLCKTSLVIVERRGVRERLRNLIAKTRSDVTTFSGRGMAQPRCATLGLHTETGCTDGTSTLIDAGAA